MIDIGTDEIDREYIARFFRDRDIEEYAVVSGSSLHAPEGRRPCDLLPSAQTMILFGAEMDENLFSGTLDEISSKVRMFETKLRNVADDLIFALQTEGFEAGPVRSIMLQDGTIKGLLSLNHCAADAGLGEIGDNRLLISPRFGSRVGLGAVVTSRHMEETPRLESTGEVCTHCNRCIRACPEHALSPGEIDLFRCRNVTGSVPGFFRPVVFRFIQSGERIPFSDRLLNILASRRVNTCAECLIACPHFHGRKSVESRK
jgi:epoxyqueuosine reductase QueG